MTEEDVTKMDAGTDRDTQPDAKPTDEAVEAPLSLDEEMAEIKKLLEEDPEDFQAQCRLGEIYFAKGLLDDALANVSKAIEMAEAIRKQMDQSLAMYYANRGTIHATKGNIEDAMAQYRKALEINPRDVLALFNLGRALYDRDVYMEAIRCWKSSWRSPLTTRSPGSSWRRSMKSSI